METKYAQVSGNISANAPTVTTMSGPTLPIPAELEMLDEAVTRLGSVVDGLTVRLGAVLPLTDKTVTYETPVMASGSSELAQRVYRARSNVTHLTDLIADLVQRAEL